jgi:hypothetical protein
MLQTEIVHGIKTASVQGCMQVDYEVNINVDSVWFEVFTVMKIYIVIWVNTPCNLVSS